MVEDAFLKNYTKNGLKTGVKINQNGLNAKGEDEFLKNLKETPTVDNTNFVPRNVQTTGNGLKTTPTHTVHTTPYSSTANTQPTTTQPSYAQTPANLRRAGVYNSVQPTTYEQKANQIIQRAAEQQEKANQVQRFKEQQVALEQAKIQKLAKDYASERQYDPNAGVYIEKGLKGKASIPRSGVGSTSTDKNRAFAFQNLDQNGLDDYTYIAGKYGQEFAFAYLDIVAPAIVKADQEQKTAQALAFAEEHPFLGAATTVAESNLGGIDTMASRVADTFNQSATGRATAKVSVADTLSKMGSSSREGVGNASVKAAQKIDAQKVADSINSALPNANLDVQTVRTAIDDSARFLSGTAIDTLNSLLVSRVPGGSFFMGASAGADAIISSLEKGADIEDALLNGVIQGAFEEFFERQTIGNLKMFEEADNVRTLKVLAKNIAKASFSNASEEFNTELADRFADFIVMGDKSEFKMSVQQYMQEGYDEQTAYKKALSTVFKDGFMAALGGFISGGFSAGAKGVINYGANKYYNLKNRYQHSGNWKDVNPELVSELRSNLDLNAKNYKEKIDFAAATNMDNVLKDAEQTIAEGQELSDKQKKAINSAMTDLTEIEYDENGFDEMPEADYNNLVNALANNEANAEELFNKANSETQMKAINDAYEIINARNEVNNGQSISNSEIRETVLDRSGEATTVSTGTETETRSGEEETVSIRNDAKNLKWEYSSAEQRGLKNGTSDQSAQIVPATYVKDAQTPEAQQMREVVSDAIASGIKASFFVGTYKLKDSNGTYEIRGYQDGNTISIRADSPGATIKQLYDHEKFHWMCRQNPQLLETTRQNVLKKFGSGIDLINALDSYAEDLGAADLSADEILEEFFADSYAGIDVFGTQFAETVRETVNENKTEVQAETKAETKTETKDESKVKSLAKANAIGKKSAKVLENVLLKKGIDIKSVAERNGVEDLSELTDKQYSDTINNIREKESPKGLKRARKIVKGYDVDKTGSVVYGNIKRTISDGVSPSELSSTFFEEPKNSRETYLNPYPKERLRISGNEVSVVTDRKGMPVVDVLSGRDFLIKKMNENHISKAVQDHVLDILDTAAQKMEEWGLKYTYVNLNDINNAKIIINQRDGSIVLRALVKNGEYPVNIDLTKECEKRVAFGKFINTMANQKGQHGKKTMLDEISLSEENIIKMNEILRDAGFDTACLGCFVEARRYHIEAWANDVLSSWNDAVDKIKPNAKYFNFGDKDMHMDMLSTKELSKLNDELESYKSKNTSVVSELMEDLIEKNPSFQKKLRIGDLISTNGRTNLHRFSPEMESLIVRRWGTASPKSVETFTPYNYELSCIEKIGKNDLRSYVKYIAGVREQSFSDYIATHFMDALEKTADLSINKLNDHIYTKQSWEVKLFGLTGRKFNMSIMFNVDGDVDPAHAGLRPNGDYFVGDKETSELEYERTGKKTFVQSFSYNEALKIQHMDGYSKNCGMIGVGYSWYHIRKLLDDNEFGYIIGYHKSNEPGTVQIQTHMDQATNYEKVQNTCKINGLKKVVGDFYGVPSYATWKEGEKTKTAKNVIDTDITIDDFDIQGHLKKYGGPKTMKMLLDWLQENNLTVNVSKAQNGVGDFPLYRDLEKTKNPKKTADNYITWCLENGYLPEFYEFADHPNYFNFVYDFTTYDHNTGEYSPQLPVKMNFPSNVFDLAEESIRDYNDYHMEQAPKEAETFEKMYKVGRGENVKTSRETDSEGNQLTENQQRYFEKSKVRDADGKLVPMYHGTSKDFTVFDKNKIGSTGAFEGTGFNFTPSRARASSYAYVGKGKANVLEGYVNISNPISNERITFTTKQLADLIAKIDPTGDYIISDYAKETRDYGSDTFIKRESMTTARSMMQYYDNDVDIYSGLSGGSGGYIGLIDAFQELGYDGLIHYESNGNIKTAVAFDSNQFKNIDNQNPTSNEDIRYSKEQDKKYLELAKNPDGNKEALQKMVEKAARDNGYNSPKLYHGTSRFGFTSFDLSKMDDGVSIFTTDDENVASTYSGKTKRTSLTNKADSIPDLDKASDSRLLKYAKEYLGEDHPELKGKKLEQWQSDSLKRKIKRALRNGIYSLYGKTDNMLTVDANGSNWNHIGFKGEGKTVTNVYVEVNHGEVYVEYTENGKKKTLTTKNYEKVKEAIGDYESAMSDDQMTEYWNTDTTGFDVLTIDKNGRTYDTSTTRGISQYAKAQGFDGVILRNVIDTGSHNDIGPTSSSVYVYFNPSSLKSAESVAYDDNGNVIPLSERFNSINEDIRYSREGGYDGYSMSNRARRSYENGEMPLSKWNKSTMLNAIENINPDIDCSGINLETLKQVFLDRTSWHHTSKYFNKTDFYSLNAEYIQGLSQSDVDEIKNSQITTKQKQRDNSLDNSVDNVYFKALIIAESGMLSSERGAINRVLNELNDDTSFNKALDIIKARDNQKVEQWRKLPSDHYRQEYVKLYDNDFNEYVRKMYADKKLSRNSNTFKNILNKVGDGVRYSREQDRMYERRAKNVELRNSQNREIALENGATEKQVDAIEKLAKIRHEYHTNMESYWDGNGNWGVFDRINRTLDEADLPTIDFDDFTEIPTADDWYDVLSDEEKSEYDYDSWKWREESGAYTEFYDAMSNYNEVIERYMQDFDNKYGTKYAPTGLTRMYSREWSETKTEDLVDNYNRLAAESQAKDQKLEILAKAMSDVDYSPDKSTVRKIAKSLRDSVPTTTMKLGDIESRLSKIYETVRNSRDGSEIYGLERSLAEDIIYKGGMGFDADEVSRWNRFKDKLKTIKLKPTSDIIAEVGNKEDFDYWKRMNWPTLVVSNNGLSMDDFYKSLNEWDSNEFPDGLGHLDAFNLLREKLTDLKPKTLIEKSGTQSYEEYVEDMVDTINDAYFSTRFNPGALATAEEILKKEYRKAADNYKAFLKQKDDERIEKRKARQDKYQLMQDILKRSRRLVRKKGDANFKAQVQSLIGDIDLVAPGIRNDTKAKLEDLKRQVEEQASKDANYKILHAGDYTELFGRIEKKHLSELTPEELNALSQALLDLEHSKMTYDREIKEGKRRMMSELGSTAVAQQNRVAFNKYAKKWHPNIEEYTLNMLNPTRAMAMLDGYDPNGVFTYFGKEFNDGQTKAAKFKMETEKLFESINQRKDLIDDFSKPTIDIGGGIKISKGMRIALYLHSLNKSNLTHIAGGGIKIPNAELYAKGEYARAYALGKKITLLPTQVNEIVSKMSDGEKEYAKICQKFFNENTKKVINETSMLLDGYEKAIVENYFPIKTDSNFLATNVEGLVKDATIEGWGNLKERVDKAKTPILLEDASKVVLRQMENTAKYYGLAIPIRNWNMFYKFTTKKYGTSIKEAVSKAWPVIGQKYLDDMITDLQSSRFRQNDALGKVKSLYAGTVLNLNLGVAIKQSASYPFAASVIGWDALGKGARKVISKADYEYMDSITPWGYMRRVGLSGTPTGEVAKQRTTIDNNTTVQKLKSKLDWIRRVDVKTTDTLFFATEEYVKAQYPNLEVRGPEYNKKVAETYNEVLQRTQPSYDTMQRNAFLRSDSAGAKLFGMFKTQTFNMGGEVIDAWQRMKASEDMAAKDDTYKGYAKESKKALKRTMAALIVSQAMLSVLTVVANAVMHKMKPYRDEETGEITAWSLISKLLEDFASSFAGILYGGSEAQSVIKALSGLEDWYDITYPGLDAINDFVSSSNNFRKALIGVIEDGSQENWDKLKKNIGKMVLNGFGVKGIPANNIYNIANAFYLWGQDIVNGQFGTFNAGKGLFGITDTSPTAKQYSKQMIEAVKEGNDSKAEMIMSNVSENQLKDNIGGESEVDENGNTVSNSKKYNNIEEILTFNGSDESKGMLYEKAYPSEQLDLWKKNGGTSYDFMMATKLAGEIADKDIKDYYSYVYASSYTDAQKRAWLYQSNKTESDKYKTWKEVGSDDEYIYYKAQLEQFSGDDKQKNIIRFIKQQPKKYWKALWELAGYKENSYEKKMGALQLAAPGKKQSALGLMKV